MIKLITLLDASHLFCAANGITLSLSAFIRKIGEENMMKKLEIKPNTLVENIQRDFNEIYPYLRLDFLKCSKEVTLANEKVNVQMPISRLSNKAIGKSISIEGNETVDELLMQFEELGLFVCLLRQSGRSWITASYTRHFTLAQQNEEGAMLSIAQERTPEE